MRILFAVVLIACFVPIVLAQIPDCADYTGVPRCVSMFPCEDTYRSLVVVGDHLCAIAGYYDLQGWRVESGGLPQPSGLYETLHDHQYSQLAVHGQHIYGSTYDFGVMIHEMIDGVPAPVDSILVTRSSQLVAVADDLLITNRGDDRLLFFDLAGPVPVLVDSLDLADLAIGGAHGAGGLVLVQTTSPPRAHILDAAARIILGAVDIPWTTRTVSWDGRLALLHDADGEETHLLDVVDPASPVVRSLPQAEDIWLVGGTLVEGDLWLSGCDFDYGGILVRFDMTDPANPVALGKQPGGGAVAEGVVAGGYVHELTRAIVMCTMGPPSLQSTRIGSADPLPERIGYEYDSDLNPADQDAVAGEFLCRTNGRSLQIVDFSDPTAPVLRGDVDLPEDVSSEQIHTSGSLVVVAGSGSGVAGVGGRIFVYDISDPDAPAFRAAEICMRFRASAVEGHRIYTFGVDDDLYVWDLDPDGSIRFLVEHTNLTYDEYTDLLAYDQLLFAIDNWQDFHAWDFTNPYAPIELTEVPTGDVYDFSWLERWDGGIYWFGRTGFDQYAYERMAIEPDAAWTVRLLWRTETDAPTAFWGNGHMDAGDRLYLSGPGVLALDLETEPPSVLGLIPAFGGWNRLVNGYPVVEHYHSIEVWAPACGSLTSAPSGLPSSIAGLDAWPNPFNPRLNVAFTMDEAGPVRAAVYDLCGRRLRTLARGFREPGRHQLEWDGRDGSGRIMPAGVYVVRMDDGAQAATRRVTMVK